MRGPILNVIKAYPHLINTFAQILENGPQGEQAFDRLYAYVDELPHIDLYLPQKSPAPEHITDRELRKAIKTRVAELENELLRRRHHLASLAPRLLKHAASIPDSLKTPVTLIEKRLAYLKAHLKPIRQNEDLTALRQVPLQDLLPPSSPLKTSTSHRLTTTCPFHQEKTPSFVIFTNDNHFHCYGCQAHGDVITFVQKLHSLDFKRACEYLAQYT